MKLKCKHDIVWITGEFLGVYPLYERGLCKHCKKEFKREKKKGGVYGAEIEITSKRTK